MKIKNPLLLMTTFSLLAIVSSNSFASINLKETTKDIDETKVIETEHLSVDENFAQGGINYTLFKNLKAYVGKSMEEAKSKAIFKSENLKEFSQDPSLDNSKKVLLNKGGFKIYVNTVTQKSNSVNSNTSLTHTVKNKAAIVENETNEVKKQDYKVAYNNQTKRFGIITGNAIIKLDPAKEIQLPNSSFQIVKSYKHLGLYIVKIPENIQFKDAIAKLKDLNPDNETATEDQRSRVNVEVLENFKSAM